MHTYIRTYVYLYIYVCIYSHIYCHPNAHANTYIHILNVYTDTNNPIIRFLGGENCVLIAYGMTNAGKTHTIQGTTNNPGSLPRLVEEIFKVLIHIPLHVLIHMLIVIHKLIQKYSEGRILT